MKKEVNILSLLNDKTARKESSNNFSAQALMNKVTQKETDTHLVIHNFPSAFGDTQNKNNRVYDWSSLKEGAEQFNGVHEDNPYFGYIFDGHRDEDSYENIIGKIITLRADEEHKCILSDLKINKGAKAYETIANIVKDGDPIGISMRIISPNAMFLDKSEIDQLNDEVMQLSEDNAGISELMGKDEDIEYISGSAFIQRFDLTQFPSFNKSFVAKSKSESGSVKFNEYKESSCMLSNKDRCITEACKFKHTVKDFIHLISTDESITTIKDNPKLYDDMLKFSYMNLSEFDFDDITKKRYLADKLADFKIDTDDVAQQTNSVNKIVGKNNLLNYVKSESRIGSNKFITMLNDMLIKMIDVDDIFYQIVTINFLHWATLSTLVLHGKSDSKMIDTKKLSESLTESVDMKDKNGDVLIDLLNGLNEEMNVYDFTNLLFTYVYSYVDRYSSMTAPITIVNESFKRFNVVNVKSLFKRSFIKN